MKTHTELGITAEEHAALIATIDVLRAEQIVFNMARSCSVNEDYGADDQEREQTGFALKAGQDTAIPQPPCGTACCIGGTMSILMQNDMKLPVEVTPEMGAKANNFVWSNKPLERLFFDSVTGNETPDEGIAAIKRFLDGNTGNPWLAD